MEHSIVGLFLCNLSLFVTRIAVFTCIWRCTVGSGCSVCTGLLFLCKKSHSLQQFCCCTSFLRSVFLHNVLIDISPCARVVCQLLAQVFQQQHAQEVISTLDPESIALLNKNSSSQTKIGEIVCKTLVYCLDVQYSFLCYVVYFFRFGFLGSFCAKNGS